MQVLVGSLVIFFGTLLTAGLIELGHPQREPAQAPAPVRMVAAAPTLHDSMAAAAVPGKAPVDAPQGSFLGVDRAR